MKKGQKTQKKLEFRLKNKENRQRAGLKSCFWALIGTNRDELAFLGRRAGRRVSVSKSGLSRRDRDVGEYGPFKSALFKGTVERSLLP